MKRFLALLVTAVMVLGTVGVVPASADALTTDAATELTVMKVAGEVEIPFSAALSAENLADKVTLVKGGVNVPVSVSLKEGAANTLVVKYGELEENADYTLTVKEGLASADGASLAANYPITLSTTKPVTIAKEDFSGYAEGDEIIPYGELLTIETSGYQIKKSNIDNDMYLEMTGGTWIKKAFDPITEDFAMELVMDFNEADSNSTIFRWSKTTGGNAGAIDTAVIEAIFRPSHPSYLKKWFPWGMSSSDTFGPTSVNPEEICIIPETDVNGMQSGKIVASRNEDNTTFDLELSDSTQRKLVDMKGFDQFTAFEYTVTPVSGKANPKLSKLHLYRISPLKVLTHGISKDGEWYDITMTDEVTVFGSDKYFNRTYYNTRKDKTFSIPMSEIGDSLQASLAGLRSDDGAFSYDTLSVQISFGFDSSVETEQSIMKIGDTLEVPFASELAKFSLKGKVSLTDSNGKDVPIAVGLKAGDAKTVTVAYGDLKENEAYTLTFKKGIFSADETMRLTSDKTIKLTTDKSHYIVKEDFSGFNLDAEIKIDYESSDFQIESVESYIREENGDKYLEMTGNTYIKKSFEPITEDFAMDIELDATVAADSSTSLKWSRTLPSAGTADGTAQATDSAFFYPIAMPWKFENMWFPWYGNPSDMSFGPTSTNYGTEYAILPEKSTNNMQYGKVVASRNEDNTTFDIETTSGTKRGLTDMKGFDKFTAFELNLNPSASASGNPKLSKLDLYRITPLKILKEGVSDNKLNYEITMSDDITVFGTDVYLSSTYYNEDTRTFEIPLYLVGETPVTVSLEGLRTDDGAFSYATTQVAQAEKLVTFGEFTTDSESITVNIDSALAADNPFIMLALYDNDKNLVKTSVAETGFDFVRMEFGDVTLKAGYTLKCFVWGSVTSLIPLTSDGREGIVCQ